MGVSTSTCKRVTAGASVSPASHFSSPQLLFGPLPAAAEEVLTSSSSCDVLVTKKQLVKGVWARFDAEAFYRQFPAGFAESADRLRLLRHLLIAVLHISKFAEKEGEQIEVDELGEGSYSHVYGLGPVAVKAISDSELPWVHRAAVANSLEADRLGLGPSLFGYGTLEQTLGSGRFKGTVIFMERLEPLGKSWSEDDTTALLADVQKLSCFGFHNDIKMPNILRRRGRPNIIDFDLMEKWKIKVAVTKTCIEHDMQSLLEPQGDAVAASFREYYDLFAFSLTLQALSQLCS